FLVEKGNNVAFVRRRVRFKGLLPTSRGRYLEVQIYHRRRQAVRIQYQSSERRKRKRQHALSGRDRFHFPAYSRLVFETQRLGPHAPTGIREGWEQGRISTN